MTTALYRRYRPETFTDVIGQEHVTEPLMQALRSNRVNHAYLFSGPRGCGKTTSARILARCLNCEQGPTPTPCGTCDSCVALARGGSGSVDVIEIDAASHGGVDDARDLRERASYGPASSRYKIYIIDEAHMVTPQGFNALLKIVEEPPEHVKFIFATTEPEKVIGTIRSRTHHYPFRLVPPLRLQDYMEQLCGSEEVAVAPGVLSFVVRAGGGSVRDSLSVLDQLIAGSGPEGLTYEGAAALLGFTEGELLDATVDGLAAGDGAAVFRQIDKVIETGHDPRRFVEDLLERLRDLIVVAAVPDGASSVLRGVPDDQLERMRQQSGAFGPGALSRAADIVNAGLTEMTGATAPRLQLELICARVLLPGASGEKGYAARLDRLERRLEMGSAPAGVVPARPAQTSPRTPQLPAAEQPDETQPAQQHQSGRLEQQQQPPVTQPSQQQATQQPPATQPAVPPAQGQPTRPTVAAPQSTTSPGPASSAQPAATPQGSGGSPREAEPGGAAAAGGGGGRATSAGGVDTDTIRRAWPDVLAKVFTIRRVTWTFLSEHAKVLDYDGQRLLLGIGTVGLANTFRSGQHAELVRQALVEVLGVDTRVEGIPTPEAPDATTGGVAEARSPAEPRPAPAGDPRASGSAGTGAPLGTGQGDTAGGDSRGSTAGDWTAGGGAGASGGWDSPGAPPEWARDPSGPGPAADTPADAAPVETPAAEGAGAQQPATATRSVSPMARARQAVARETAERGASVGTGASGGVADDSVVSADDEDIADTGGVGLPVIQRVLGGTVIGELEQ